MISSSIKSQLGSPSTLLNPGVTTSFLYRVIGRLTPEDVIRINNVGKQKARMKALFEAGCSLEFEDVENSVFKHNLLFLDYCMPPIVAECLSARFDPTTKSSRLSDIAKIVAQRNPIGYPGKNVESFYEHKLKVLLLDAALGMTPSTEWNGRYDANGGYIVVKEDGDLLCYHFYERNDVEDYLFHNTRFDASSRRRYNWGSLFYGDDGQLHIRLNLQIRFIK